MNCENAIDSAARPSPELMNSWFSDPTEEDYAQNSQFSASTSTSSCSAQESNSVCAQMAATPEDFVRILQIVCKYYFRFGEDRPAGWKLWKENCCFRMFRKELLNPTLSSLKIDELMERTQERQILCQRLYGQEGNLNVYVRDRNMSSVELNDMFCELLGVLNP